MLTKRDREFVEMLSRRTPLATMGQIASPWWGSGQSSVQNATRRIAKLSSAGWLRKIQLLAQPLLELTEPIVHWQPGDKEPRFGAVEWRLKSRWKLPARPVRVVAASPKACRLFSVAERRPLRNPCQVTHDLHVTAIYLHYRRADPALAGAWRGEAEYSGQRRHRFLPDALLVDDADRPLRAIEFGGRYDTRRLRHFHEGCAAENLAYEVW